MYNFFYNRLVASFQAKPYSWMPGGGMAIEIAVQGSDKVRNELEYRMSFLVDTFLFSDSLF